MKEKHIKTILASINSSPKRLHTSQVEILKSLIANSNTNISDLELSDLSMKIAKHYYFQRNNINHSYDDTSNILRFCRISGLEWLYILLSMVIKYKILFNFLECLCSKEKLEEWIGDMYEESKFETQDKNYPQWIIKLMFIWRILVLIDSAIKIKICEYLSNWLRKISS